MSGSTTGPTARRVLAALAIVVLVASLVLLRAARVSDKESAPLLVYAPTAVRVDTVRVGTVTRRLVLQGRVLAGTSANLAPRTTAPVVECHVRPGDRVERGDLLVRLDDERLAAQVRRLEFEQVANRSSLRAAHEKRGVQEAATGRDRVLAEAGGISREALERSEAAMVEAISGVESADARIASVEQALTAAREQLADTRIVAPWAGEIVDVYLDPGDLAVTGRPVVRLVRDGDYRVRALLPQESETTAGRGSRAVLEHAGRTLESTVSRVSAGLDPSGLTVVELDLAARPFALPDGSAIRVVFDVESLTGKVVPVAALLEGARGSFVFVVSRRPGADEEVVTTVAVEPLLVGTDRAVVRGGVAPGDRVVVAHPSLLMGLSDGGAVLSVEVADERVVGNDVLGAGESERGRRALRTAPRPPERGR